MRRAFTLIELLVVIAIIAILAAILFPVFAQAKAAAKKTSALSNIKQSDLGILMYSNDVDDRSPYYYGTKTPTDSNVYHNTDTWVGNVYPYVKSRSVFFDSTTAEPTASFKDANGDLYGDPYYGGTSPTATYTYRWQWVTNISINADGFAIGGTGSCDSASRLSAGTRTISGIDQPSDRLMLSPTQYGTLPYAWMYFQSYYASWPYIDQYVDGFSWSNLVWDARKRWGGKFTAGYADGHAGKFGREKFVGYSSTGASDAKTLTDYCTYLQAHNLDKFWGPYWTSN